MTHVERSVDVSAACAAEPLHRRQGETVRARRWAVEAFVTRFEVHEHRTGRKPFHHPMDGSVELDVAAFEALAALGG